MLNCLVRSKTLLKIIDHLYAHVDGVFYVRELAALISDDPGNISRELSRLEKDGLVLSEKRGSLKLYRVNQEYAFFRELKQLVAKQRQLGKVKKRDQQLEMAF